MEEVHHSLGNIARFKENVFLRLDDTANGYWVLSSANDDGTILRMERRSAQDDSLIAGHYVDGNNSCCYRPSEVPELLPIVKRPRLLDTKPRPPFPPPPPPPSKAHAFFGGKGKGKERGRTIDDYTFPFELVNKAEEATKFNLSLGKGSTRMPEISCPFSHVANRVTFYHKSPGVWRLRCRECRSEHLVRDFVHSDKYALELIALILCLDELPSGFNRKFFDSVVVRLLGP